MRSLGEVCLGALRLPPLAGAHIAPVAAETVRERAPGVVSVAATLDFKTLRDERGGLFDFGVFGPGTVIDAAPFDDDQPIKRVARPARVPLVRPIAHPLFVEHVPDDVAARAGWTRAELDRWLAQDDPEDQNALATRLESSDEGRVLLLSELVVLPPDLRPLRRLADDRWAISPLNDLYMRAISRNLRWQKALEEPGQHTLGANDPRLLGAAALRVYENEDLAEPLCDGDVPKQSLRGTVGGTAALGQALAELVNHPADRPLPRRLHRASAVLFAMGFELRADIN
jgi:DNA-directed RNA polymerase beta' subunit